MSHSRVTRRDFVKTTAGATTAFGAAYWITSATQAKESKNDRPILGAIGLGGQGRHDASRAKSLGDIVALCDVDSAHIDEARKALKLPDAEAYSDYRKLLDRKDIDAVTIGTPDHWHVPIAIAALEAGKHVYCEKPLTLTIDEGKLLVEAVKRTGKVLQVGTQQRGDQVDLFARAVATVRSGQLGKIKRVVVKLPLSTAVGGPFPTAPVPANLNWDFWLGQAPKVEYCPQRCHYQFRWWYEYSGGVMTDWGAHHMDITHWALDVEHSGPQTIDGSQTKLPNIPNGYNTPREPRVDYTYAGDIQVHITTDGKEVDYWHDKDPKRDGKTLGRDEGVQFEGDKGSLFVCRHCITGPAIDAQNADPKLKEETNEGVKKLFKGNVMGNHMANFFQAWKQGKEPISDVVSQHRTVSACHLGNISIRLGRKLQWDPVKEEFVGDSEANSWLKRHEREPYTIKLKS